MYLSELRIWNFRKFGIKQDGKPGLTLNFTPELNLLVGENNSGKTTIVDAIKYTLHTQSYEYMRLELEDFYLPFGESEENRATKLRIECNFKGFSDLEAKNFLEWLGMEKNSQGTYEYFLKLSFTAQRNGNNIYYDIKAGADNEGKQLSGEAKNLLRTTYLKPLRDAEKEMSPGKNSRLSQILDSHDAFKGKDENHYLYTIIKEANEKITKYFKGLDTDDNEIEDQEGKELLEQINTYLKEFSGFRNNQISDFTITKLRLKNILERLNLDITESKSGLGSQNLLFIATELLLLKRNQYQGLRLAIVEEIEAHLHVQAQIRLVEFLHKEVSDSQIQLIMTTHSTDLASKVKLKNLIICKDGSAFPMGDENTQLNKGDYLFLERFLDSTKANLFFAQGVILVEGDSENLLLPIIALIIDKPLSLFGVTIVNVGNTAFLRYSNIFKRKEPNKGMLNITVSAITDNDIKPDIYSSVDPEAKTQTHLDSEKSINVRRSERKAKIDGQFVKLFISPDWTLEYDIALGSLRDELLLAILQAEKIGNSDVIGLTKAKEESIDKEIIRLNEIWKEQNASDEEKAFYIYYHLMLEKKISKAITAQCLANILEQKMQEDKEEIKRRILGDSKLQYIIQAINYASKGAV
ncbi:MULTISPECIES: AAA family ATPase [unclassified Exiguobacterium]|uniref:ATP-dependent nuclease n=1 Tax=unclassified Exiguobacterium TaxID=2644629 RepID=UPI001BE8F583|nr:MULTISPECIES: AAA family ATPase [unclassified Exiguobacterium]